MRIIPDSDKHQYFGVGNFSDFSSPTWQLIKCDHCCIAGFLWFQTCGPAYFPVCTRFTWFVLPTGLSVLVITDQSCKGLNQNERKAKESHFSKFYVGGRNKIIYFTYCYAVLCKPHWCRPHSTQMIVFRIHTNKESQKFKYYTLPVQKVLLLRLNQHSHFISVKGSKQP